MAGTTTNHLHHLLARTAAGERSAFRHLYAGLALPIWLTVVGRVPDQVHATAVTRGTFMEFFRLASSFDPARGDVRAWINAIAMRRAEERLRDRTVPVSGLGSIVADHDLRVDRELARLLGAGRAIVRVRAATYVRVDDFDDALTTIARHRAALFPLPASAGSATLVS